MMNAKLSRHITVRRESFDFNQLPLYYHADNPFISHMLTALSLTFPNGERFFVHAVRNVRDQVKDATLQHDVSAFIGQEAMHSHAHEDFNEFAIRMGLDVQPVIDFEHEKIEKLKGSLGKKEQLAITCALEHFTAIIAQYLLENDDFQQGFHPEAARLWMWHALEETEHKAVAFDVYQDVFADDVVRKRMMRIVTVTFLSRITQLTLKLVMKDPVARKQWRKNLAGARRIGQLLQALVPAYLDYYRDGFHPNQHDTTDLATAWSARLSAA
jgi:predicted metal-dependent hydrolase